MSDDAPSIGVAVPIRWDVPDETPTHYATNIVVQFTDSEFIVSFFEAYPPLLIGTPEEIDQQAESVETVRARCLARIIIAANRMPAFVNALQGNLNQYVTRSVPENNEGL